MGTGRSGLGRGVNSASSYEINFDPKSAQMCKVLGTGDAIFKNGVTTGLKPVLNYFSDVSTKLPTPEIYPSNSMFLRGEVGLGGTCGLYPNGTIGIGLDVTGDRLDITAAHEFGHALLYGLYKRSYEGLDSNKVADIHDILAKAVVTSATSSMHKSFSDWKTLAQDFPKTTASKGYALTNPGECVAEAVAVYSMHGNKAPKFALAIMKSLKKVYKNK